MSVDQLPPGKARSAARQAQLVRYGEYVDKQIESTRRLVKIVDVMTALLVIATGTVGFLLTAAVVEHWLVPDGFSLLMRLLLFVALVGGGGYYAIRRLWPLCVSSINPAYAAQAIEHDNPTLKNSLLNLLLFRQHREEVTDAVYETLEEQAAQRLTRVPIDSAVDRTQLLRLGYALMIVVAVAALYKIFSPKDPFVTAERVLIPWADVVPASRVSIDNVEPGAVTLARGEVLTVSADVRGISDDDPVVIRYTTADGQAVDRPAAMTPTAAGLRFTGQIPPAEDGAKAGVAQNLRYRIEAGDARSREYTVTVVAAPTITVERIDYDYPDYTGFADRSVERLGDIRAIEGTRVTIHARANQPIDEAAVDFEADGRRDIVLNVDGNEARTGFQLVLRDDRQTPKFTSYVLRFTDVEGRPNRDPVKYPIDVLPDYGPEVAILAPAEKARDVRLDETVTIEVEARDPDFALAEVRLHGDAAGHTVIDEPLLTKTHTGRFTGRLQFTPNERGLQPGDVVRYWVTASDERPNEATSDSQTLRITSPDPKRPGQPPPDHLAQRDKREPQQNEDASQGNEQQGEGAQGSEGEQPGEPASAGGQSGDANEQDPTNQSGDQDAEQTTEQQGESQANESQSGGESSGEQNADGQSAPGDQGNQSEQSGDAQQQPGGTASARPGDSASENNSQQPSAGQQSSGDREGSRDSNSQPGANGTDGQQRENANRDGQSEGAERQSKSGGKQSQPGEPSSPVSPEGDNDGEAFERIQKFLQRDGKLPEQNDRNDGGEDAPARPEGEGASAGGQSDESDEQNDTPQASNDSTEGPGAETRPGDKPEKTNEPSDQGQPPENSPSPGGQQTSSKGESGAGNEPEQNQGAPDSQPNMKPADKLQQKPSGDQQSQNEESPAGGRGKRESDSQGEQGGDRTGGGEEGGGQKSDREGTGSSGQNQSADEGAGESSEQGAGQDSPNAGADATAKERTGQEGSEQAGEGSSKRDGTGDQSGGKNGGRPSLRDGARAPARSEQSQGSQESGTNAADGAGRTPNSTLPPAKTDGTAPDADAANLEYARKQTDLVLETLAEQMKRKQVDKRLLDELGWSEADLKRFLERWQELKAAARDDTPSADAAQRELDDALRSLGLRRGPLQQSKVSDDDQRDLRQGYRGAVPLEYQERLRAYNQGVSRARQQDE